MNAITARDATQDGAEAPSGLDLLAVGREAIVVSLMTSRDESAVLRSMGLEEGQPIRVLRRAPGGDPLHVRLGGGGEFAVALPVARSIRVRSLKGADL